jgi:tetratricopeptide (TPR) repeat protein
MMHVVYMLCYSVFGLRPWGFHLVSALLHAGVCVLVYLSALRLFGMSLTRGVTAHVPLIAALLFASHPVHVEPVAWAAGIPDLTYSFFCLLSLVFYFRADESGRSGYANYAVSLFSYFIALFCKEPALVFPLLLIAWEVFAHRSVRGRWRLVAPYVVVALVYLAIRAFALGGLAIRQTNAGISGLEAVAYIPPLFGGYLAKLLLPAGLYPFHPFEPAVLAYSGMLVALVLSAGFLALCLVGYRRDRALFFCLMLLFLPLAPALYIPAVGEDSFSMRYLYLPSAGFAMAAAYLLGQASEYSAKSRRAVVSATVVAVIAFSVQTAATNRYWKDSLTLWSYIAEVSPGNAVAHKGLGCSYTTLGLIGDAERELKLALDLRPDDPDAHFFLGYAYACGGRYDKAITEYEETMRLNPEYSSAYLETGAAYLKLGLPDRSAFYLEHAVRLNPYYAEAYRNLGEAYERLGRPDSSAAAYDAARRLGEGLCDGSCDTTILTEEEAY